MADNRFIDLNADLGESDAPAAVTRDHEIMAHISSCNIASGGHAGSEATMRNMLRATKAANIMAGAHPSYPDRENFGRESMRIAREDLRASLIEQIETLRTLAHQEGVPLHHVKPHGALYNDAADDPALAVLIGEAIAATLPNAIYVGLAGSAMAGAAAKSGLRFSGEGFADRRYTPAARLQPRGEPGAVLESHEQRVEQALALVSGKPVSDSEGGALRLDIDTICLHSDSDGALESARLLRDAIEHAGFAIAAPE